MKTAMLFATSSVFVVGCFQSASLSEKDVVSAVQEQVPGATSIAVRSILPIDRQKEAKKVIRCNTGLDSGFTHVAEVTHVVDLGKCPLIKTLWTKCGITKEDQVLCFKHESGKWAYSSVMDPNALIPGGTAQNPAR